jgi:hypothetical protein
MDDGLRAHELSLVKLYMELTGASESTARNVFMHVCCRESDDTGMAAINGIDALQPEAPARNSFVSSFESADAWLRYPAPMPAGT